MGNVKLAETTVTPVNPPILIKPGENPGWADEADVLVVGWGGAGASAAIEAARGGADVLVIDRFAGGGATTLSGGIVYAGGGTAQQKEAGYIDTVEDMFNYLKLETNGVVSDARLRRFCEESLANQAWLEEMGVRFGSTTPAYKTSYPADGIFLYYSGNELVPSYRVSDAIPAPRGHRVVASGQSGSTLFAALRTATHEAGARTMTEAAVRRLVCETDDEGGITRVVGVEAHVLPAGHPHTARHRQLNGLVEKHRLFQAAKADRERREAAAIEQELARPILIRARRAVVLTTGGFIFNPDLLRRHGPAFQGALPIGGAGCDGSGLRLGQTVGAASRELDNVSAWRFITPPSDWPKGIIVNAQGQRICDETMYGAALGHHIVCSHGGRAWLIIDQSLRARALKQCLFDRLWAFQRIPALIQMLFKAKKGRNADELAHAIGADPGTLSASIQAASMAAKGEGNDPTGKHPSSRHALTGKLYALDISLANPLNPMATLTLGGLVVDDETGQVLDTRNRPIPGLYAAGRAAVGVASSHYVSGLSLADCVFSGRLVGRAVGRDDGDRSIEHGNATHNESLNFQ